MSLAGRSRRRGLPSAGVSAPTDRRFRRPDIRPDRRRRAGRALVRAAVRLTPALMVLAGAAWLASAALNSRLLTVQHIVVRGAAHLSSDDVLALVAGMRGENILRVDFETYRRRVLASSWVADVALSRILPSTVEIRVVERTPIATARVGRDLYLVDDTGVILDEAGPKDSGLDLPIVDGLAATPVTAGAATSPERAHLTAALLTALDGRPDLRGRVSQIDVSNAHDAVVMFDDAAAWLHLGDAQFVERLATYFELAPALRERFHDIDSVDLRFDPRVFVHSRPAVGRLARAAK